MYKLKITEEIKDRISKELIKGEKVEIPSFGTFLLSRYIKKNNVKDGKEIENLRVRFLPKTAFKDELKKINNKKNKSKG